MAVVFSFAGAAGCVATLLHDATMNPVEGNASPAFPSMAAAPVFLDFCFISGLQKKAREQPLSFGGKSLQVTCLTARGRSLHVVST